MTGPPPRRVLLYGVTGSGKSTAALRIGAALGLPVTLVDELTWEPGWVPVAEQVQRTRIQATVDTEAWLLDSAYGSWRDIVLPRVDLIVGLDYPRWLSLQRLLRRTVSRWVLRTPACNGNTETLRQLFSRESIVVWHFKSFARKRRQMRAWALEPPVAEVRVFARPSDLDAWIGALDRRSDKMSG